MQGQTSEETHVIIVPLVMDGFRFQTDDAFLLLDVGRKRDHAYTSYRVIDDAVNEESDIRHEFAHPRWRPSHKNHEPSWVVRSLISSLRDLLSTRLLADCHQSSNKNHQADFPNEPCRKYAFRRSRISHSLLTHACVI